MYEMKVESSGSGTLHRNKEKQLLMPHVQKMVPNGTEWYQMVLNGTDKKTWEAKVNFSVRFLYVFSKAMAFSSWVPPKLPRLTPSSWEFYFPGGGPFSA